MFYLTLLSGILLGAFLLVWAIFLARLDWRDTYNRAALRILMGYVRARERVKLLLLRILLWMLKKVSGKPGKVRSVSEPGESEAGPTIRRGYYATWMSTLRS